MAITEFETINIAEDFSDSPGARYRTDGPHSGEEFYEDFLRSKLNLVWKDKKRGIFLNLDGTYGYASSFWSEVFIRVVRDFKDKKTIKKKFKFKSEDEPLLINTIIQKIDEAKIE
jgi:hypothetical protein